jgi:hypothetical protein
MQPQQESMEKKTYLLEDTNVPHAPFLQLLLVEQVAAVVASSWPTITSLG